MYLGEGAGEVTCKKMAASFIFAMQDPPRCCFLARQQEQQWLGYGWK